MSTNVVPVNTRNFTVAGKIECGFNPESEGITYTEMQFLKVEVWCKQPLNVLFLGNGVTDAEGNFSITFEVEGTPSYMVNGKIENAFLKVYYKGKLISGANPYINQE